MDLFIAPNGTALAIYGEEIDLHTLGTATITRASHVEPDDSGHWFADMVDGPQLGPFTRRSEALEAEVAWLIEHRLLPAT